MFCVEETIPITKKDTSEKIEVKYFIAIAENSFRTSDDYTIAYECKLDLEEYRKTLIEKFKGFAYEHEIFFDHYNDCKKAIEWLNSIVIMNELLCNKE